MAAPRRLLLAALALSLFTQSASTIAAEGWPVARGPSHEPDPYRYDSEKPQAVPRAFLDDAAACVLYAGNSYLVEADGTVETVTHEVTRLNGRKAVEKLGEYHNITFEPSYQKLTLNVARLHKAGGRVVEVDARHIQLRDVSTDYQVYDHEKQLIISFPSLEVGDTLEVKWTLRGKNPEHGGQFFTRYAFGDPTYPVVRDELRVRLPKGMDFRHAVVSGRVDVVRSDEGANYLYRWVSRDRAQLPQDEDLPPKEELRPAVVCSTFPSWEAVGRWRHKLRGDSWAATPEIRQAVAGVTKGLTDPVAKARALTYWLRRNVRYVSDGEKHDYTPHAPGLVFSNRFGDCKDTSQLLAVMLREAGLKVALATLGVLDDGQVVESVPSPWGTHAILLVTAGGKGHWIDTTLSLGGWDYLPKDDRDRLCYVVDDRGQVRLVRTPPLSADDNRFEQTTDVWVGADGSSRCDRTTVAYGGAALAQRDAFVETPAGERRRQVTAELLDSNSRTRLVRLDLDERDLQDYDQPVTARLSFEIPNHFGGTTEREGSVSDGKVWGRLLAHNLDYDRKVALELPAPFESRHRYILHLPAAYALDVAPQEKRVLSQWGRFDLRVSPMPGRDLALEFLTRVEKTRVEPRDFDAFRRFHEEVAKEYRVWLTLRPVQEMADAPYLEAVLTLAPDDAASAAALARLYLQNNRAAEARRVLARAQYYRPGEVTLWELSVKAAGSPAGEEAAQRELATRFPGDPRHAVALGAVLVERGKYDGARAVLAPLSGKGAVGVRAQAEFQLARCFYRSEKPDEALRHLDSAAGLDADVTATARACNLRGHILEDLGKLRDAEEAYQLALSLDREAEEPLDGLVRLSLATGRKDEALDYLRRYTVVVGDGPAGQLAAADHYLRLERYDDAYELASRALRAGRHTVRAHRVLGMVWTARGDEAQALRHLERAPSDPAVLAALIHCKLATARLKGLSRQLDAATPFVEKNPALTAEVAAGRRVLARRAALAGPEAGTRERGLALDALACAEQARAAGRLAAGVEALLARAFAVEPIPGAAYALRARLALDCGKLGKALADADAALARDPNEAGGYYVRGRVRLERCTAGADDDLRKANELTGGKDADVLHAYAEALYRGGNLDRALACQREAVRLRPQDRDLSGQLAAFEKATQLGNGGGK